jgi:hypothetical protein
VRGGCLSGGFGVDGPMLMSIPDRHGMKQRYFRGDAALANPEVPAFLEAERFE